MNFKIIYTFTGTTTAFTGLLVSKSLLKFVIKLKRTSVHCSFVKEKKSNGSLPAFADLNQFVVKAVPLPFLKPSIPAWLKASMPAFLKSCSRSSLNYSTAVAITNFIFSGF
jgi:hypothetical protein